MGKRGEERERVPRLSISLFLRPVEGISVRWTWDECVVKEGISYAVRSVPFRQAGFASARATALAICGLGASGRTRDVLAVLDQDEREHHCVSDNGAFDELGRVSACAGDIPEFIFTCRPWAKPIQVIAGVSIYWGENKVWR